MSISKDCQVRKLTSVGLSDSDCRIATLSAKLIEHAKFDINRMILPCQN